MLALTSCVSQPATEQGRAAGGLYDLFMVLAAIIFTIVASLIGWSIVRYRRRPDDDSLPDQFHTNVKLEILWFAIPQLIVIGLFIASATVVADIDEEVAEPTVVVRVESFQWGWRFSYEGSDVVIESLPQDQAEIVLPTATAIAFELTSRDVIHSFYVPEFLIKRDVIPGHDNRLDVTIDEAGTYTGRCAEFCGLLHDRMDFSIRAVPASDYERWLAGAGT